MGAGIAQVAAVAGHPVLLADAVPGAAAQATAQIAVRVREQVAKGRLPIDPVALNITAVAGLADLAGCEVVIEAVVEDLGVKRALFAELEQVTGPECLLASNSSSLSPTAMAAGLARPERLVGMHFFNPVPVMRLVEIISGLATAPVIAERAAELAERWGKTVVRSAPTPGFIVNRIARPFYAEAWRLHEEGAAPTEVIDAVLTGAGGFRMGPFGLMDLIGHDVNEAVTKSVWEAFGFDPRFAPSLAQRALVEAGWLGRKTGRGCYDYAERAAQATELAAAARATPGVAPVPSAVALTGPSALAAFLARAGVTVRPGSADTDGFAELPSGAFLTRCTGSTATALAAATGRPVVIVDRAFDDDTASAAAIAASDGCPPTMLGEAVALLRQADLDVYVIADTPGLIVTRTVAMLANLAADALACQVASVDDIDAAMRLGVNYPLGPLAWARRWGASIVLTVLDELENWYRDGRYRACPLLRRAVMTSGELS
jgi:3-hydroxybutyryl-CoA dehydrogenase